tara:strand:- start:94 stop:531 length:438 start_codon:yes stop_codon:yes gene_type:complete
LVGIIPFSIHLILIGIRNPGVDESPIALLHAGIARHEGVVWQESVTGLDQRWTQWHDSFAPLQTFESWTSKSIPASHPLLEDIIILAPTQKRIVSFETKYPHGPKSKIFFDNHSARDVQALRHGNQKVSGATKATRLVSPRLNQI